MKACKKGHSISKRFYDARGRLGCRQCNVEWAKDAARRSRNRNPQELLRANKERARKYREKSKVREREAEGRWRRSGIRGFSMEKMREMLQEQGGVCAICGKPPRMYDKLRVDHEHKSGKARGLLCIDCNRRIVGQVEAAPQKYIAALKYLGVS